MFELSDASEIIPIASNFFYPNFNPQIIASPTSCSWSFKISPGFKLKIHIKSLRFESKQQSLKLSRSNISTTIDFAGIQYFEGSEFTLEYNDSGGRPDSQDSVLSHPRVGLILNEGEFGFGGIVTAVKGNPKKVDNCDFENGTFTNFNSTIGYPENSVSLRSSSFKFLIHFEGVPNNNKSRKKSDAISQLLWLFGGWSGHPPS